MFFISKEYKHNIQTAVWSQCVETIRARYSTLERRTTDVVLNAFVILYDSSPKCHWGLHKLFGEPYENISHINTQKSHFAKKLWLYHSLNEFTTAPRNIQVQPVDYRSNSTVEV